MQVTAIQTRPLVPPKDDLVAVLDASLPNPFPEESVLVISSKVVAIAEGRCEAIPEGVDVTEYRRVLAMREAEYYLPKDETYPYARIFTIMHGALTSSAGIDQSNGNGYFILWPENPMEAAQTLHQEVQRLRGTERFGVIVSDSRTMPLRNGAIGFCIGYAGIRALHDYRHTPDIFGRHLEVERLNVIDSLAAAAGVVMGEGGECTPLVLMRDIPHVAFSGEESSDPLLQLQVPMEQDVFAPFIARAPWQKGGA